MCMYCACMYCAYLNLVGLNSITGWLWPSPSLSSTSSVLWQGHAVFRLVAELPEGDEKLGIRSEDQCWMRAVSKSSFVSVLCSLGECCSANRPHWFAQLYQFEQHFQYCTLFV